MTPEEIAAVLRKHRYEIGAHPIRICHCGFYPIEDVDFQTTHRAHVAEVLAALMPEATETVEWACQWPDDDSPIEYPNSSTDLTAPARKTHRIMGARIFRRTRTTTYADRVTDWEEVDDE